MRDQFPGHYRPSEEEFEELWASALIVPDTNVLLALYRLSEVTQRKLLKILEELQGRLYVPYQVAYEFQRRRLDVIEEQEVAYDSVDEQLRGFARNVGKILREHPNLDKSELEEKINDAIAPVREYLQEAREGHPDPLLGGDAIGPDSIRDAVDSLVANRIGPRRDLAEVAKEGAGRYDRKQPPGWEDRKKPDPERYGDLAIWLDLIDKAKRDKTPIILVTQERKEDWWWIRRGKIIGPQPELVAEMRERGQQSFYLYGLDGFMEKASEVLGLEFSEDDRVDVARAQPAEVRLPTPIPSDIASYVVPPTLASGSVRLSETPARLEWMDSALAEGRLPGFGSIVKPPRWYSAVEVDGTRATLSILWKPRFSGITSFPAATFTCLVFGPNETVAAARVTGDEQAELVYPDDFGDQAANVPGVYSYTWTYEPQSGFQVQGGTGHQSVGFSEQIATGGFELVDQVADGS